MSVRPRHHLRVRSIFLLAVASLAATWLGLADAVVPRPVPSAAAHQAADVSGAVAHQAAEIPGAVPRQAADLPRTLVVDNEMVVLGGTQTYDSIVVRNSGLISVAAYAGVLGGGRLELHARHIEVDASSRISADGVGWRGIVEGKGEGPGGGEGGATTLAADNSAGAFKNPFTNPVTILAGESPVTRIPHTLGADSARHPTGSGAGGGYGGRGGDGIFQSARGEWKGGRPYGTADGQDAQLGSAGGAAPRSHHEVEYLHGGNGGGVVILRTPELVLDGTVSANGAMGLIGQFDATGSGSGGTVLIEAGRLALGAGGKIAAAGSLGGQGVDVGGSGGGGRVKIFTRSVPVDKAHVDISPGEGPCPGDKASPHACEGTLYVEALPPLPVYLPVLSKNHCWMPDQHAVALVVDVSRSMGELNASGRSAIEGAVQAADGLVSLFGPSDRAAVVSFAGAASIRQGLTGDRAAVRRVLHTLSADTPGSRLDLGLLVGQQALSSAPPAYSRTLVLLTDGRLDQVEAQEVVRVGEALRGGGIAIYALAFGPAADADLLAALTGRRDRVIVEPGVAALGWVYGDVVGVGGCR